MNSVMTEDTIRKYFDFIPKLYQRVLSAPSVAESLSAVQCRSLKSTGLTAREREAVLLKLAQSLGVSYGVALHTFAAKKAGLNNEELNAIKTNSLPDSTRLATLIDATNLLVSNYSECTAETLAILERQGLTRSDIFELCALIGFEETLQRLVILGNIEIDEEFQDN